MTEPVPSTPQPGPRLLDARDLWHWTAKLTDPTRHRLQRDSGTTQHLTLPCMLDQLEADLASTGSAGGRSKPGSRAPLNVTALSLLGELEVVLVDALVSDDLGKRATLALSLRAVTAHVASTETEDAIDWWARLVKGWAAQVQSCLPGEDDGPAQVPIRGMQCPTCRTSTVERRDGNDLYRDAALVLVLANRLVRHALCRACGSAWWRGEPLWQLADSARAQEGTA